MLELLPEPTQAAGDVPASLADRLPAGEGRLVLVLRNAHLHAWQREQAEALLAGAEGAVVVETGVPLWRPSGASAYVATHGAGRVNLDAAAELLMG